MKSPSRIGACSYRLCRRFASCFQRTCTRSFHTRTAAGQASAHLQGRGAGCRSAATARRRIRFASRCRRKSSRQSRCRRPAGNSRRRMPLTRRPTTITAGMMHEGLREIVGPAASCRIAHYDEFVFSGMIAPGAEPGPGLCSCRAWNAANGAERWIETRKPLPPDCKAAPSCTETRAEWRGAGRRGTARSRRGAGAARAAQPRRCASRGRQGICPRSAEDFPHRGQGPRRRARRSAAAI